MRVTGRKRHLSVIVAALGSLAFFGTPTFAQEGKPPTLTAEQEKTVEEAFKAGNTLLEAKKYAEALVEYKKCLTLLPDEAAVLWNSGMAAFFAKDYPTAEACYQKLKARDTNDGFARSKLIQTYQASGDVKKRDTERTELLALHQSGKDSSRLAKTPSYCRDQFTVGDKLVLVYEMFDFKPRLSKEGNDYFAVRYNVLIANPDGTLDFRIEIGWNTPEKAADGTFKPGGSFYFDAYYSKGPYSRKTFGLFENELDYAAVRAHVLAILADKVPVNGATPREKP
jgi:tetratricopeptide (TPR) repeat protein